MADQQTKLSRPRFLRGFIGAGLASLILGNKALGSPKQLREEKHQVSQFNVQQDHRSIARNR